MSRRQARETALQSLYQLDVDNSEIDPVIDYIAEMNFLPAEDFDFMKDLVCGSKNNEKEIDMIIAHLSRDWDIKRLARVDHNIMRMAIYEIKFRKDIPFSVSINEAVELAKIFGGEDSGRFVNGILAKVDCPSEKAEDNQGDISGSETTGCI
ncbi:MAG: transcription antitermination factor NusB [Peptococcaceae bacterium]|nr:transcription antitermination factor NusB [Peptococcaceae bacterium]